VKLTDLSTIRALCAAHGFSFSKGLGQNFIVNPGVCPKIAEAAGLDSTMGVLEIGPGFGVLTQELARRAGKVVAIEIDRRLPPLLAQTLAEFRNVAIVEGDVMELDLAALLRAHFPGMRVAVCANLPYYITSPVLMRLLEQRLPVEQITVMVQKEAAERLVAQPGTRMAGAITCAVRYYARPQMLFAVQPGSFYPPPKVTSAVIRLRPHAEPPVRPHSEAAMFRVIRAAFGQRRKTAANAVSSGLGLPKETVLAALCNARIPATARPEQLTLQDYAAFSDALGAALGQAPDNLKQAPDAAGRSSDALEQVSDTMGQAPDAYAPTRTSAEKPAQAM